MIREIDSNGGEINLNPKTIYFFPHERREGIRRDEGGEEQRGRN